MTEWTTEEDEAFNEVEKHSNLGKQILREITDSSQRNAVLEEVAKEIEKMTAFGPDTIASFAVYIRNMKR